MFTRTGVVRRVAGIVALVMLLMTHARVVEAQESLSGEIAECITGAWALYLECLDDLPFWAELLCAARFTSDAILCFPKEFVPKL